MTKSTIISDFTYHTNKGITVTLIDGTVHEYPTATATEFSEMIAAKSKGKYFNEVLRKLPHNQIK